MITRIRELLDIRQLSPTQFADLIGVGRPVISHILSERNKPSLEVVQKIIGAFPDIALPWLLAGTGPMLAADAAAPTTHFPTNPPIRPETAPIPTPFVAAAPAPASPSRATAPPQPSPYSQPAKFRPSVASSSLAAPRVVPAPSPAASVATAELGLVAPLPPTALVPEPRPVPAAPLQPTLPLPAAFAAPATSASPAPVTSPATPVVEDSTAGPDALTPDANPAAALSFLGEPGKAIRRIVIFYRDGSFSDYLPDGR